jgi:hypothetical protein
VAYSLRTIGIIIASTLSVILIVIAVLISGPLPFHLQKVDAQSTHDLLVSYAAKDTDGDGLPDWEEALYGTDPNNPHSVSQAVTDGEAVAQGLVKPKFATATSTPVDASVIPAPTAGTSTVTDQFARALFEQYLRNRGTTPPTSAEIASFVESGVKQLEANSATPDAFNRGQVHVVGSGPDALATYAAAVEKVFTANAVPASQSEILYFADAANKDDPAALVKVAAIGNEYGKIARALIQVPVPKEAASAHLQLANSLMHMSEITLDLAALKTDPLRAMLGLGEYESNGTIVLQALAVLNGVFNTEGLVLTAGTPGAQFYGSTVEAARAVDATKTP